MKHPYITAMLLALPPPIGLVGMMCSEGVISLCWFVVTAVPLVIGAIRLDLDGRGSP